MSIHETWERSVEDLLAEPEARETYTSLRRRMSAGEFEPIVEAITQRWRGTYDLFDAYAFGQVYAALVAGTVTITPIQLGSCPSGDDQPERNNTKLAQLPEPYKATFRGGSGDDDGCFEWVEPIFIGETPLDPQKVPLEVGYTRPLTTLWHLHLEGGLARWPYGHDKIWLLRRVFPTPVRLVGP